MFVVFAFFSAIGGLGGAEPPFDCAFKTPLLESTDEIRNTTVKRETDLFRMEHLPSRFRVWRARQVCLQPAHGRPSREQFNRVADFPNLSVNIYRFPLCTAPSDHRLNKRTSRCGVLYRSARRTR